MVLSPVTGRRLRLGWLLAALLTGVVAACGSVAAPTSTTEPAAGSTTQPITTSSPTTTVPEPTTSTTLGSTTAPPTEPEPPRLLAAGRARDESRVTIDDVASARQVLLFTGARADGAIDPPQLEGAEWSSLAEIGGSPGRRLFVFVAPRVTGPVAIDYAADGLEWTWQIVEADGDVLQTAGAGAGLLQTSLTIDLDASGGTVIAGWFIGQREDLVPSPPAVELAETAAISVTAAVTSGLGLSDPMVTWSTPGHGLGIAVELG